MAHSKDDGTEKGFWPKAAEAAAFGVISAAAGALALGVLGTLVGGPVGGGAGASGGVA